MEKKIDVKNTFPKLWDAAVLVRDLEKTRQRIESLGLGRFIHPGPPEGAEGLFYLGRPLQSQMKALLIQIGNLQMEFIQPDDKPNPWKDFLKSRGEGLHHLGVQVADVEKEVNRLTALGAEVTFTGNLKGKLGAAYMDLKTANLVIEFTSFCTLEADPPGKPDLYKAWDTAVLVKDIEKTRKQLEKLGFGPFVQPPVPAGAEGLFFHGKLLKSNSRSYIARYGNLHLELIQPDDQPNPWAEFLKTKGEGIHHIGFQVPNVETEVARLTGRGSETPFLGKIKGQTGAAYVDLKMADLFIELTSFGAG
jgi:methylmalonyl-CoA/ethylmalonyl-CoA epimerase